jgi:pimeloyl-ACP methyl ester carboxylesterase
MKLSVNGAEVLVATGGRDFDKSLPAVVFLHGAGFDRSTWALHTRWFAHHGFGVLAPDLPGHGRSPGPSLGSIAEMADWTAALLDAAEATKAHLIGHSMGSLISLETAARQPRQGFRAQPDRHGRDHDGRPGSAESGRSQFAGCKRHGLDLGTRLQR